jgi:hypothetical protein
MPRRKSAQLRYISQVTILNQITLKRSESRQVFTFIVDRHGSWQLDDKPKQSFWETGVLERIAWAEASTNVSWRRETHDVGSSCAWQLAFVENVQSDLDQSTAS